MGGGGGALRLHAAHRASTAGRAQRPIDLRTRGKGDKYFSIEIYDGAALAYGHVQAGDATWPSMQDALALDGRGGIRPYPVSQNMKSENGETYTGAAVQYAGDGIVDAHQIYRQLDAVKYQYGCFLETFRAKGVATIPKPAAMGTPCPGL